MKTAMKIKVKRATSLGIAFCLAVSMFTFQGTAAGENTWPIVKYEAEGSLASHATGRPDGDGWLCQTSIDAENATMVNIPSPTIVPAGKNQASYSIKVDNNTANNSKIVRIDVNDVTTGTVLAWKDITRRQFGAASIYQTFTVDFTQIEGHALEFRVYWYGTSYTKVDYVSVETKTYKYEAESAVSHNTGRPDGDGWLCQTGIDTPNLAMVYGPYVNNIPAGENRAFFRMKVDNNTADNNKIATIDVRDATTGAALGSQDITRKQFNVASNYQTFYLSFTQTEGHSLEFRVFWSGASYLKVDYVGVEAFYSSIDWPVDQYLPSFSAPVPCLDFMDVTNSSNEEKSLFTSLKGIVNKSKPRIYSCENNYIDAN
ncbi:MAG: hypothetical protein K0R90_1285 [Oscillospiraceae bacterium]|nr:hypothetical protein [Oscillospiraceae bacterium]